MSLIYFNFKKKKLSSSFLCNIKIELNGKISSSQMKCQSLTANNGKTIQTLFSPLYLSCVLPSKFPNSYPAPDFPKQTCKIIP